MRLDVYITEQGLVKSREQARGVIMAGQVYINDQKSDKPGETVPAGALVELRGGALRYVSRGGLKLEKAIEEFGIDLQGKTAMDIGASTGGFTDCMLQNGAAKVYAVDVGYGQLDWKLRNDARVVNMERTNIRYIEDYHFRHSVRETGSHQSSGGLRVESAMTFGGESIDFASIDVSFISLTLVLPVAYRLFRDKGEVVALIKPQFEAGRENVGRNGIVRDSVVHDEVKEKVIQFAQELGFKVDGLTESPIRGAKGNVEFLIYLIK